MTTIAESVAPRPRNADATRQAVLDAAEQLFASHGYAGTSMRELAEASGVSQPLIHHHFGSKDQLYRAVKQRAIARYDRLPREENETRGVYAGLSVEMRRFFKFLEANPTVLRLTAWGRLEGDLSPWPGEDELMKAMVHRIAQAQAARQLRADLNPMNLAIMLVGLAFHWLDNREYYGQFFEGEPDDTAYLQQAISVLFEGAAARPSPVVSQTCPER